MDYPDRSFDWVILNQSMQETRKIDFVIEECLRVAGRVIVGFPNFAHIRARSAIFFCGRTPVTSIKDFFAFCRRKSIAVVDTRYLGRTKPVRVLPNLLAINAIFVLTKEKWPAPEQAVSHER
jgi:hypothetical protein